MHVEDDRLDQCICSKMMIEKNESKRTSVMIYSYANFCSGLIT